MTRYVFSLGTLAAALCTITPALASESGFQDLGNLGSGSSYARGVNADGSVVVGYADIGSGTAHAFRWEDNSSSVAMQDLGTLGGNNSAAYGVNADGSVVVGYAYSSSGIHAFRWEGDSSGGTMQSVEDWLRDNGVTVTGDITNTARGVSADGNVIVGDTLAGIGRLRHD